MPLKHTEIKNNFQSFKRLIFLLTTKEQRLQLFQSDAFLIFSTSFMSRLTINTLSIDYSSDDEVVSRISNKINFVITSMLSSDDINEDNIEALVDNLLEFIGKQRKKKNDVESEVLSNDEASDIATSLCCQLFEEESKEKTPEQPTEMSAASEKTAKLPEIEVPGATVISANQEQVLKVVEDHIPKAATSTRRQATCQGKSHRHNSQGGFMDLLEDEFDKKKLSAEVAFIFAKVDLLTESAESEIKVKQVINAVAIAVNEAIKNSRVPIGQLNDMVFQDKGGNNWLITEDDLIIKIIFTPSSELQTNFPEIKEVIFSFCGGECTTLPRNWLNVAMAPLPHEIFPSDCIEEEELVSISTSQDKGVKLDERIFSAIETPFSLRSSRPGTPVATSSSIFHKPLVIATDRENKQQLAFEKELDDILKNLSAAYPAIRIQYNSFISRTMEDFKVLLESDNGDDSIFIGHFANETDCFSLMIFKQGSDIKEAACIDFKELSTSQLNTIAKFLGDLGMMKMPGQNDDPVTFALDFLYNCNQVALMQEPVKPTMS